MASIEKRSRPRHAHQRLHCRAAQPAVADRLLVDATEQTMKRQSGFISASIHRSCDGTTVVNYSQWRRREDFEAMTRTPEARPHMQAAMALAQFEPILCDVADSVARA